ncbi:MAG: hypothetical protein KF845_00110 [Cyclobacteriaceae bacterium]|nr:hypothetical protein [Cyclobacteriaceae bacterium]
MNLHIQSHDAEKIVLKRQPYGLGNRVFLVVGVCMLALSVYLFFTGELYLHNEDGELRLFTVSGIFMLVLLGFGVVLTLIAGFMLPATYKRTPKHIVFDHQRACMVVCMTDYSEEGIIPYQDINSFRIYEPKNMLNADENQHHVLAEKKSGGEWTLVPGHSRGNANKLIQFFTENVLQQNKSATLPAVKLPDKISVTKSGNTSLITWSNPYSFWSFSFLLISLLLGTGTVLAYTESGRVLFLLAAILLLVLNIWILYLHTRKMALSITADTLEYYEFSRITKKRSKMLSIPLEDIAQVVYKYLPTEVSTSCDIWITTKQDAKKKPTLLSSLKPMAATLTLRLTTLNPVECLHLEVWLQQEINARRKGGEV